MFDKPTFLNIIVPVRDFGTLCGYGLYFVACFSLTSLE